MSNPARTGTQKALHVVSIIMIVLGVLVILSGASLIALGVSAATMGMDQPMTLGDTETTADTTSVALGIIVLAMGLVQLVVAAFGLRGSKDASKIESSSGASPWSSWRPSCTDGFSTATGTSRTALFCSSAT